MSGDGPLSKGYTTLRASCSIARLGTKGSTTRSVALYSLGLLLTDF